MPHEYSHLNLRLCFTNGTCYRWLLSNRCALKEHGLCYLICLRHLLRSRTVINWNFLSENTYQHATCSELPSIISIMSLRR